jgi:hypothetical protein
VILGDYTFEWLPDKMDIPRPMKATAIAKNLGGVAYLSWPPLAAGERIALEWNWMPVAQYEALLAIYLAGEVVEWSLPTDGEFVPTGTALSQYNVKAIDLEAAFFEVVDVDQPYREKVKMTLLVRA